MNMFDLLFDVLIATLAAIFPWNRAIFKKLLVTQLVKKFPYFVYSFALSPCLGFVKQQVLITFNSVA
jgi:hypothetical protein